MKPKKSLETAGIYRGDDLLDRLERMAVRREQEGIHTDALICRAAIEALKSKTGRTSEATIRNIIDRKGAYK